VLFLLSSSHTSCYSAVYEAFPHQHHCHIALRSVEPYPSAIKLLALCYCRQEAIVAVSPFVDREML
jgi:hypothetical protein